MVKVYVEERDLLDVGLPEALRDRADNELDPLPVAEVGSDAVRSICVVRTPGIAALVPVRRHHLRLEAVEEIELSLLPTQALADRRSHKSAPRSALDERTRK